TESDSSFKLQIRSHDSKCELVWVYVPSRHRLGVGPSHESNLDQVSGSNAVEVQCSVLMGLRVLSKVWDSVRVQGWISSVPRSKLDSGPVHATVHIGSDLSPCLVLVQMFGIRVTGLEVQFCHGGHLSYSSACPNSITGLGPSVDAVQVRVEICLESSAVCSGFGSLFGVQVWSAGLGPIPSLDPQIRLEFGFKSELVLVLGSSYGLGPCLLGTGVDSVLESGLDPVRVLDPNRLLIRSMPQSSYWIRISASLSCSSSKSGLDLGPRCRLGVRVEFEVQSFGLEYSSRS
uniref:Uncharacterized protein n=1 Tax=Cannabis sativa TaxID=3483 RepID=A0A803QSD0_CANSA